MQNVSIRTAASAFFTTLAFASLAPPAQADSSGKWQSGQETYDKVCGYCHETNVGPVIRGRDLPEEYIRLMVRNGNRAMPSFRATEIDDQALAEVAQLVSGKKVP